MNHPPLKPPRHRTYLLRCWEEREEEDVSRWRVSLEDARTGARRGFVSLEDMFAFLQGSILREEESGSQVVG